ncbi:radical SAM protein [candidate division TA06 bacterium]|nr:radical SAM protein [candidate division TA06 bacterium]
MQETLRVVALEATRQCNLNCPHCFTNAGKAVSDELSTKEWHGIIDQIAGFKPKIIGWSGGEPLLRPDFLDIFCYAYQKHGLEASLVSNGLTLTPENLTVLKNNGLLNVQISLDGSTHEVNSMIRGGTDEIFQRILKSFDYCREVGVPTVIGVMPHPSNIDDIPNIIKLAESYGIKYLRFCTFVPFGRGQHEAVKSQYFLSHQDFKRFLKMTGEYPHLNLMIDPVSGPLPPDFTFNCRNEDGCPAGKDILYITANGDVYPCTALWGDGFKVDSLRSRTLKDIYHSPALTKVGSHSKSKIKGACRACDNFSACGGACRGTAYSMTGDLSASLPYCYYREERRAGG